MANQAQFPVEVVYAHTDVQVLLSLQVVTGTTAQQAIEQSGILQRFPEINLSENKIGIFGKVCPLETELHERDRVEIYRPLIADPKESRRKRAAKKEGQSESATASDED